ncbi:MAG: hypothetical protein ABL958_03220 [Bdellovibrionia bacterium]
MKVQSIVIAIAMFVSGAAANATGVTCQDRKPNPSQLVSLTEDGQTRVRRLVGVYSEFNPRTDLASYNRVRCIPAAIESANLGAPRGDTTWNCTAQLTPSTYLRFKYVQETPTFGFKAYVEIQPIGRPAPIRLACERN